MASPQDADGGMASNIEDNCKYIELAVAESRHRVVPLACGLGEVLTTLHCKNVPCYEMFIHIRPRTCTDILVRPKQWKRDMRFGTYPTKDSLGVADTLAKAKLQDLLHNTTPHETVLGTAAGKIFKRLS